MSDRWILVDTSVWINALSPQAPADLKNRMETLLLEQRIATTPLIQLELLSGAVSDTEYKQFEEDLNALALLEITPAVWSEASHLGYRLRRAGLTLPNTDILLAAVAIHYRCALWHNDKHFNLIARHTHLLAQTA
ncbi:MAG: PIN domain nuclease [Candidatus Omnitrophica bacterium]|nr:PIN domain nuclease [Candidatus Omnitrophota bacterium]